MVAAVVLLVGCGPTIHDPAFEEAHLREAAADDCGPGRCLEIVAVVTGNQVGTGRCAIYGLGDPDDLEPVAAVDEVRMDPEEPEVVELLPVETDLPLASLNVVCSPMVEG